MLSLDDTYVALSFRSRLDREQRLPAHLVLADRTNRRMIITGDPGSGRSTLLKAYGLGVLRQTRNLRASDLSKIGPTGEVPFFVQLRGYARHAATQPLVEYLIDHVLVYDAALRPERARALLERLVRDRRALIFLDGLDEVPQPAAAAVRDAIGYFCRDNSVALPTQRARVIVTCRRQDFLGMADQWVPSFASTVHTLSPLRDNEILQYANSLQKEFTPPRSPQTFLADLRGSGVIDYHRTPLVLAISAGLYLGKVGYEIPRTVYLLYDTMVRELLGRHEFRRDATGLPGRGSLGIEGKLLLLRHFGSSSRGPTASATSPGATSSPSARPKHVNGPASRRAT